ncbi:hypothetical protein ACFWDI_26655 [Streptomyces sp. NPDC060064]|uniref:hypothetical protein n=1 Tax=Streptomyces sp. NPDC060064 TaxID=3347049 RepID=UPI00369668CC
MAPAAAVDGGVTVKLGDELGRDGGEGERFAAAPVRSEVNVVPGVIGPCGGEQAATELRTKPRRQGCAAGDQQEVPSLVQRPSRTVSGRMTLPVTAPMTASAVLRVHW